MLKCWFNVDLPSVFFPRVGGLRKIAAPGAKYKLWEKFVQYDVKPGGTYTNHVAFKRPGQ